jgi:hypothetical protein
VCGLGAFKEKLCQETEKGLKLLRDNFGVIAGVTWRHEMLNGGGGGGGALVIRITDLHFMLEKV